MLFTFKSVVAAGFEVLEGRQRRHWSFAAHDFGVEAGHSAMTSLRIVAVFALMAATAGVSSAETVEKRLLETEFGVYTIGGSPLAVEKWTGGAGSALPVTFDGEFASRKDFVAFSFKNTMFVMGGKVCCGTFVLFSL